MHLIKIQVLPTLVLLVILAHCVMLHATSQTKLVACTPLSLVISVNQAIKASLADTNAQRTAKS